MKKKILLEDRPPQSESDCQMQLALVVAVLVSAVGAALFFTSKQVL